MQNGVLHPRFSIHSVCSDNTVTEPWLYPELTAMVAASIRLRSALLPTLYTAAVQAHERGLPVARPLALELDIGPVAPLRVVLHDPDDRREVVRSLRTTSRDWQQWHYDVGLQRLVLELPASAIVGAWRLDLDLAQGMSVSIEPPSAGP